MILFDLRCLDGGEVFEGWFGSGAEYDEQSGRGLIQCPFCQSTRVEKAPMAPRVSAVSAADIDPRAQVASLAAMQEKLLAGSTWVGDAFAGEARAMQLGEVEPRPVHGRATGAEARALAEEGVPILPLPLPVTPPRQVN